MGKNKKPNFLIIMSDEHAPMFSGAYGNNIVQTPNMNQLATNGVTFDGAYCNSPLCVPSRASFMTGNFVSNCETWDNATSLSVDRLTWPYILRSIGYDVTLSGKMHLLGTDRLHGFSRQLAFDPHVDIDNLKVDKAKFGLNKDGHPIYLWEDGIPIGSNTWEGVRESGPGSSSMIEADDEIERAAIKYLDDPKRKDDPWALVVGFVAPHFPFVVPEPYFSMYYPDNCDLPLNTIEKQSQITKSQKNLIQAFGFSGYTDDDIMRARAAYYGLITFLDDKIGNLVNSLSENGLDRDTVIVYTSDHGESLGEHGLWRKMNFYEESVRVPLQISWPEVLPKNKRCSSVVSLVDLTSTIIDLSGYSLDEQKNWSLDGDTLLPLMMESDKNWKDEAFSEYFAHGTDRSRCMLRRGDWKLCFTQEGDEVELYNLKEDPAENVNLATDPKYNNIKKDLINSILLIWKDPDILNKRIKFSQESRTIIRKLSKNNPVF